MIIIIFRQVLCEVLIKDQIFVFTGGPGFGKTMLVKYFASAGYKVGYEVAGEIIQEQREKGGMLLPGKDIRSFQNEVLKRRIDFFNSVSADECAFSDRGIPDQIAYARYHGFGTPAFLDRNAKEYRYNEMVFITPPWKEIYKNDMIRTESYETACVIHQFITEVYREYEYKLIEIPFSELMNRAEFVLNLLNKKNEF